MTVFFDLDQTLLLMDQYKFLERYFSAISSYFEPFGFEPKSFIKSLWTGSYAMTENDGSHTNEQVFWNALKGIYGDEILEKQSLFDEFYKTRFEGLKGDLCPNERAVKLIAHLKSKNVGLVLATNPLFPRIAQEKRLIWSGCDPRDFLRITSYENSSYTKPNPQYYIEIMQKLGLRADECVMVGNDASDDLSATGAGIRTFILTDRLINDKAVDISNIPHGNFDQLEVYLSTLIA